MVAKRNRVKARKSPLTVRSSRPRSRGPRSSNVLLDPRVQAWDRVLRDPCSAPPAPPCYAGIDSGYLVRTVNLLEITGSAASGNVNTGAQMDAVVQFTPFNLSSTSSVLLSAIGSGGTMPTFTQTGLNNFITTGGSVARYRPVAACVKWVPTGAVYARQGSVALGYSGGQVFFSTQAPTVNQAFTEAQRIAPNGSQIHEVRWLPTAVDENFTDTLTSNNTGAGTMLVGLKDIDATYYGGDGSTSTTIKGDGYLEITCVWEWVPARTIGVSPAPRAPLPYTSQQVLSSIGDMGAFLFEGIRAAGPGVIRAATQAGIRYFTNGMAQVRTRGPSFLTMM